MTIRTNDSLKMRLISDNDKVKILNNNSKLVSYDFIRHQTIKENTEIGKLSGLPPVTNLPTSYFAEGHKTFDRAPGEGFRSIVVEPHAQMPGTAQASWRDRDKIFESGVVDLEAISNQQSQYK